MNVSKTDFFEKEESEIERLTPLIKVQKNLDAIELLKELLLNDTAPKDISVQQRNILKGYTGWGGCRDVFDRREKYANRMKTAKERMEKVLSREEYGSCEESSLTGFYTPESLIEPIIRRLDDFGFKDGSVLEPSAGIGSWLSGPEEICCWMNFHAVEKDVLTGQILRYLYPEASVQVCGFEVSNIQFESMDAIVGNIPFGDYQVSDPSYNAYNLLIHDYFMVKLTDVLKYGGIMAVITSTGTLDKRSTKARELMRAKGAEFIGAIRLPEGTFSGTKARGDLIFIKKSRNPCDDGEWLKSDGVKNSYFVEYPEMELSDISAFPDALALLDSSFDIEESESIYSEDGTVAETFPARPEDREYSHCIYNGKLGYIENRKIRIIEGLKPVTEKRIRGIVEIRDTLRELIDTMSDPYADSKRIRQLQETLNNQYDSFKSAYGVLNNRTNRSAFKKDIDSALILAIETENLKTETFEKSDVFTKRTVAPKPEPVEAETVQEALMLSLNHKGKLDINYIAALLKKSPGKVSQKLLQEGMIYIDPEKFRKTGRIDSESFVMKDRYLSGNVRRKFNIAKEVRDSVPDNIKVYFDANVRALEAVVPEYVHAEDIIFPMGANWISLEIYQKFAWETFLSRETRRQYGDGFIKIYYDPLSERYKVDGNPYACKRQAVEMDYGSSDFNGLKILEFALNGKVPVVMRKIEVGDRTKYERNQPASLVAQECLESLKKEFTRWILANKEVRDQLEQIFNDRFHSNRLRHFDGSMLEFPLKNPEIELTQIQQDAVARALFGGSMLLSFTVGLGKSFTYMASIMESKRLGICSKACVVVPKNLLLQTATEFYRLYPTATLLLAREEDFKKDNRERFLNKIAFGDFDAVILTREQFTKIPMSPEYIADNLRHEIMQHKEALESCDGNDRFTVANLQKRLQNLKTKLLRAVEKVSEHQDDKTLYFEQLGFNMIVVDEAHAYKNLPVVTGLSNISGVFTAACQRATDMEMKCSYIRNVRADMVEDENFEAGIIFVTGTPVSNSLSELYTMNKYLRPLLLKSYGVYHFDSWRKSFGEVVSALEIKPEGNGFQMKERFSRYINVPQLMEMIHQFIEIKDNSYASFKLPLMNRVNVETPQTDLIKNAIDEFTIRADAIRDGLVSNENDNMLKVLMDGRKLGVDPRLLDPNLPDDPDSKVNIVKNYVVKYYHECEDRRGTQVVFCDLGVPHADDSFSVYVDLKEKLVLAGIPREEIAFIHDAKNDKEQLEIYSKMNEGEYRILIGSTERCGTGANFQRRLYAMHNLDCPFRPSDLEQRVGRIVRNGNIFEDVYNNTYVANGSVDAFLYQTVERKARFIYQVLNATENIDQTLEGEGSEPLNYAQLKAIAIGNPLIKKKIELENEQLRLRTIKTEYDRKHQKAAGMVKKIPDWIEKAVNRLNSLKADITLAESFSANTIILGDETITDSNQALSAIGTLLMKYKNVRETDRYYFGEFRGLKMYITREQSIMGAGRMQIIFEGQGRYEVFAFANNFKATLRNIINYFVPNAKGADGKDAPNIYQNLHNVETRIAQMKKELAEYQESLKAGFPRLAEMKKIAVEIAEVTAQIDAMEEEKKESKGSEDSQKTSKNSHMDDEEKGEQVA